MKKTPTTIMKNMNIAEFLESKHSVTNDHMLSNIETYGYFGSIILKEDETVIHDGLDCINIFVKKDMPKYLDVCFILKEYGYVCLDQPLKDDKLSSEYMVYFLYVPKNEKNQHCAKFKYQAVYSILDRLQVIYKIPSEAVHGFPTYAGRSLPEKVLKETEIKSLDDILAYGNVKQPCTNITLKDRIALMTLVGQMKGNLQDILHILEKIVTTVNKFST